MDERLHVYMHEICIDMGMCDTYLVKLEIHHPVVYHKNMHGRVEETAAGQLATPHVSECVGTMCVDSLFPEYCCHR